MPKLPYIGGRIVYSDKVAEEACEVSAMTRGQLMVLETAMRKHGLVYTTEVLQDRQDEFVIDIYDGMHKDLQEN